MTAETASTAIFNGGAVIIRKYANRRLYDTDGSTYVTLDDLARMVKSGRDVIVQDAKTGEDISRSVLTQIVLDQEGRGEPLLSVDFLKDLIRLHGRDIHAAVPPFLDFAMGFLKRERDRVTRRIHRKGGQTKAVADEVRRNFERLERAVGLNEPCPDDTPVIPGPSLDNEQTVDLELLRQQIEAIQLQLDRINERA